MSDVKQKTWLDLFGDDPSNVVVHGCYLSRHLGGDRYTVIFRFDNQQYAERALEIWKAQIRRAAKPAEVC